MGPVRLTAWLFASSALIACSTEAPTPSDPPAVTAEAPGLTPLKSLAVGRYVSGEDGLTMGWPGSGVEFVLPDGGDASVTLTGDGRGYMDLVVGGVSEIVDLEPGLQTLDIVEDVGPGTSVRLTRRTEHYDTGLFTLHDVSGTVVPREPSGRILFLGDSITAGFGVAGDTADCLNTPVMHAPLESYAMLAADRLDAQAQLIAVSGRGVVHNWDYNPEPTMPAQIDFALPDRPNTTWDHARFTPDVVVTTLGTNDWSAIDPGQQRFRDGYRDMLAALRERFPVAHIVTVAGPMLTGAQGAAIRDGADWAMAELDDPKISTIDTTVSDTGLTMSCNHHPGRQTMRDMAAQLAAHIAKRTDLTDRPASERILPPDWMVPDGKAHFAKRVDEIDAQPLVAGGTLLLGDSITEAWKWQPEQVDDVVHNHGVGWDVVEGLTNRFAQYASLSPERVLVKIGTNDLSNGHTPQRIAGGVRDLLEELQREFPDARIVLQSVLPREPAMRPKIDRLNRLYADVADDLGVEWLDLTGAFSAPDGSLRAELTDDGLHLLPEGYDVWRTELRAFEANRTTGG